MAKISPLHPKQTAHPGSMFGKGARTHENLTILGFCLAYFGVMAALVLWAVPIFAAVAWPGIEFVALPATVIGVIVVIAAHRIF